MNIKLKSSSSEKFTVSNDSGEILSLQSGDNKVFINGLGGFTGSNASEAKCIQELFEESSGEILEETTWSALKTKRDSGELIPGARYRITDYITTTSQPNTKSDGHQFDIIVTALSENELSEDAKAIQHEGDTYFNDCDLSAWEIKYCIDNDTNRFFWAGESYAGDALELNLLGLCVSGKFYKNGMINHTIKLDGETLAVIGQDGNYMKAYKSGPGYVAYFLTDNGTDTLTFCPGMVIENTTRSGFKDTLMELGSTESEAETAISQIEADTDDVWPKTFSVKDDSDSVNLTYSNGTWANLTDPNDTGILNELGCKYFNALTVQNPKGVIWYMKDENGNSAYYDFKNIMVKKSANDPLNISENYRYTFSYNDTDNNQFSDISSVKHSYMISPVDNTIDKCTPLAIYLQNSDMTQYLSNSELVFSQPTLLAVNTSYFICASNNTWGNHIGINSAGNVLIESIENELGDYCFNNYFFGSYANTLGDKSFANKFNNSYNNTLKMGCYSNEFTYAWNNDLEDGCYGNKIGVNGTSSKQSYGNVFGNNCRNNTLYYDTRYNVFEGGNEDNTLSDSCYNCTFKAYASTNTLPRVCKYVHFDAQCHDITLAKSYTRYVTFEENCANITLTSSTKTTTSNHIQNLTVLKGFNGGANNSPVTITIPILENKYSLVYGYDTDNEGRLVNVPSLVTILNELANEIEDYSPASNAQIDALFTTGEWYDGESS